MRHDVDTLGVPVVKLGVAEYITLAHRANTVGTAKAEAREDKKDPAEPKELRWTRNGLWIVGGGFAAGGLVLTAARVEGWFAPDTATIVWLIALMLLSAICAAVVQVTINRRVVLTAIRAHAPADVAVLARIATTVARVAGEVTKLREDDALHGRFDKLADLITLAVGEAARKAHDAGVMEEMRKLRETVETAIVKADAVAFVDARSEAEEGHGEGVASVTHLPVVNRSASPRNRDHS